MKTIGIDIGTTCICAVCYEQKDKVVDVINVQNEFMDDSFCQDADEIVSKIRELLKKIINNQKDISAIGISTQMHGILYINQFGKALSPYYTWKETIGNSLFCKDKTWGQYLSKETGYMMYAGYGTVTHFCLKETGNIPKGAVKMVNIGDYVAMQLCGATEPRTDITIAASFGGLDLHNKKFDVNRLQKAGVDVSYYPVIADTGEIVGCYEKIPVFCAWGDNQVSFYATAMDDDEAIHINVGTGAQVSMYSCEYFEDANVEIRPFLRKGFLYVNASINGGKVYEKLADYFKEIIASFTDEKIDIYKWMNQIGSQKKETSLVITPFLYGSRRNEKKGGEVKNLGVENFYVSDFIRAYVKGMAKELYDLYKEFPKELRKERKKIIISGNGVCKNNLLKEEIRKIFSYPVIEKIVNEEAAYGAAVFAMELYKERFINADIKK